MQLQSILWKWYLERFARALTNEMLFILVNKITNGKPTRYSIPNNVKVNSKYFYTKNVFLLRNCYWTMVIFSLWHINHGIFVISLIKKNRNSGPRPNRLDWLAAGGCGGRNLGCSWKKNNYGLPIKLIGRSSGVDSGEIKLGNGGGLVFPPQI